MDIVESKNNEDYFKKKLWSDYLSEHDIRYKRSEHTFLIMEDGEKAGYFEVVNEGGLLYVRDIIMRKVSRGKGYGNQVMKFIIDFAEKMQCHKIRLETSKKMMPDAYHLYRKYGFEEEGLTKNDFYGKDWVILSRFL